MTASLAVASPWRPVPLARHGDESAQRDADRVAARALAIDAGEAAGFAHAEEAVPMCAPRNQLRQARKTVTD